jgi:hypothetical protein
MYRAFGTRLSSLSPISSVVGRPLPSKSVLAAAMAILCAAVPSQAEAACTPYCSYVEAGAQSSDLFNVNRSESQVFGSGIGVVSTSIASSPNLEGIGGAGYAEARADLTAGTLHAYASMLGGPTGDDSSAAAEFYDSLIFTMPTGVTSKTIRLNWLIDGSFQVGPSLGDSFSGALVQTSVQLSPVAYEPSNPQEEGRLFYQGGPTTSGPFELSQHADIVIFPNITYYIKARLAVAAASLGNAPEAIADFSHTAALDFDLPDGVSFISGSGTLLSSTSAVPEPASWAMTIVGLGLIGSAMRRRRCRVSPSAVVASNS